MPTCVRNATAAAPNVRESPISLTPRLLRKSSTQLQLGGEGPTGVSRAFSAPASHARERQRRPDLFQAEQMKFFPSAKLIVIEGVGHEMFAENPAASLAPVRTHLSEQNG